MSTHLSPDRILGDLANLWANLGKQGTPETGMGVLRACSMTLVVIAPPSEEFSALQETIKNLMPEHPARTIVVCLRPEAKELSSRINAACWMPFGQRRQICCEQIDITAPEGSLGDVATVIAPIAAADLPLVLWCRCQGVAESSEFERLAKMAEKVVVDSGAWPDPAAAIQRLAELHARGITLGDLSWTHLTRWREMLSQVFENPMYAAHLPEISRVRVRFSATTMRVMARYMGAWLVNALEDAGVRVELTFEPGAKEPGVELSGADFRVELTREQDRMVTTVGQLSNQASLPEYTDCSLLREELSILRPDPTFERALKTATQLAVRRET